jgi:glutathione S-transferase
MKPKLISFKLCPFVQKAVLTLLTKQVEFDIEYIDLENPPQWFLDISPLGKVPVLQVRDQVLFESSVIVEYLDEVYGQTLHPSDPLLKAQNRSWMEFGNECMMNGFYLIMAADKESFAEQRNALLGKLDQLESNLHHQPFFNGSEISLIDLSFIPLFQRLQFLDDATPGLVDAERHPKTQAWADQLTSLDQVADSAVPELPRLYRGMMKNRGGYLATLMD